MEKPPRSSGKTVKSLFDLPATFWSHLQINLLEEEEFLGGIDEQEPPSLREEVEEEPSEGGDAGDLDLGCNTCGVSFTTIEARNEHYRDDWHTFNLQRKLVGMEKVSEDKFAGLLLENQNLIKGTFLPLIILTALISRTNRKTLFDSFGGIYGAKVQEGQKTEEERTRREGKDYCPEAEDHAHYHGRQENHHLAKYLTG